MNKTKTTLLIFLLLVVITSTSPRLLAQHRTGLPPELNQDSTPSEILAWLDKTILPLARVGFSFSGSPNSDESNLGPYGDATPGAKMVFSQGFRLARLDGCHLTLRNEALTALYFSSKSHTSDLATLFENRNGNAPPPRAGQLVMWLEKLSATKGGPPRRYTTSSEQAGSLGTWRIRFTYRGFFARNVFSLSINDPERGMREIITELNMTFAFDDKEISERFNTAFRRAIKICQGR